MPANWYTDGEIATTLEGMLGLTAGSLPSHWGPVVTLANQRAKGQLYTFFRNLGYTDDQIETWGDKGSATDKGAPLQMQQALYWCGEIGKSLLTEATLTELHLLDVMPELETLTNGGVIIEPPDAGVAGGVGHGSIDSGGRFTGSNIW